MQSRSFLSISLLAIILLGAGCFRKEKAKQTPTPVPVSAPVTESIPAVSEPIPATQSAETQIDCRITADIVKTECGLDGDVTDNPYSCTFDVNKPYKFPIFNATIKSFRGFVPGLNKDNGTLAEIIEARRKVMNDTIEKQGIPGLNTCDRIETRLVAGIGDEALLAPLTLLGCDQTRVASLKNLEEAPWLLIRKGDIVAEIASYQGDFAGRQGCSSEEILNIAREYVLPAMNQ